MITLEAKKRIVIKLWLRDNVREIKKSVTSNLKYYKVKPLTMVDFSSKRDYFKLSDRISSAYMWCKSLFQSTLKARTLSVYSLLNAYELSIEQIKELTK